MAGKWFRNAGIEIGIELMAQGMALVYCHSDPRFKELSRGEQRQHLARVEELIEADDQETLSRVREIIEGFKWCEGGCPSEAALAS